MGNERDEALHEFVAGRYPDVRRSAYLMCGDWAQAGELTEAALARLVADPHRDDVDDPDGYVFAHLMSSFPRRPARREHVFVAAPGDEHEAGDQARDVLVLDALHRLAPRCRAVLVLRHWTGFAVDETADLLDLDDDRVEAYEKAGLAALANLLDDTETIGRVLHDEPPVDEPGPAVYRRAERLRHRRLRTVVATGVASVLAVSALGYVLATAVIPQTQKPTAASLAAAPAVADPVLSRVRRAVGPTLRVVPREPSRGTGWRQYAVLDRDSGRPRGMIEVSMYAAPDGLCFPVRADDEACAKADRIGDDVEYVRYADDRDVDWQVVQVISRRLSDGRVVAVMATGERGTGARATGRPPLTGSQAARLAADARLVTAFGPDENCNGPDPSCPLLTVPVPAR